MQADELQPGSRQRPSGSSRREPLAELLDAASCTVSSAGWYAFPSGWSVTDRQLPNAISYTFTEGHAEVVIDGVVHRVGPASVVLTRSDQRHSLIQDGAEPSRFFTAHFVARVHGMVDLLELHRYPSVIQVPDEQFGYVRDRARNIVRELDHDAYGSARIADVECMSMLVLLARAVGTAKLAHKDVIRRTNLYRLAPVFEMVDARLADNLRVDVLADAVSLEVSHFSRLFKELTGMPPARYVAAQRIIRARHLLLTSDMTIHQIAFATGFADPFYFSRAFKKATGVAPRAYRGVNEDSVAP